MSFVGKVVVVTGASSGIGAAAAILFCKEGAHVALVGRNEAKLKSTSEKCTKAGGKHIVINADVSKDDDAKRIINKTITDFGKLDILINNAGVGSQGSILDGNLMDSYDKLMGINLRAVIHLTELAAPHLIKTKGNIINISSIAGLSAVISASSMAYGVSKAAVIHFTKSAAAELAPSGVRVNVISPGPVKTDILEASGIKLSWDMVAPITALKRVSDAEEIADLILYIASDKARAITGANLVTDNGSLVKT
jgi:NAD(P)-dependent dehydrogenase (short-subunit alcohol dehydrogenase family)